MNQELRARILSFFSDRSKHELSFTDDRHNYILLKSRYDEETDFLYLLFEYAEDAHRVSGKADFAGIYSHLRHGLFAPCYDLRFLETPADRELGELLQSLYRAAEESVLRKVDGKPVPVTDESKQPWYDRDYYLTHQLDKEARECFLQRTAPNLAAHIGLETPSTEQCIEAINHPEALAEKLADAYIRKNALRINQRLWEISLLTEKLKELEGTPGEHHMYRRIMESVDADAMKNVTIQIDKDGKQMSCKIETCALTRIDDYDYSTWRMDARGRAEFTKLFDRSAHLCPSDISRITYGRKVLYEKNEA